MAQSKEKQREYREANRDKVNEYAREWQRKWRADNPEKAKEKDRKRYLRRRKNDPMWQARQHDNQRKRLGRVDSGRRKGIRQGEDMEYAKTRKATRNSYLKKHYNITLEDQNELFVKQEGRCAICGRHGNEIFRGLMVDHDHQTGRVRGLLCHNCNAGIGNLRDDIQILQNAIAYLQP